MKRIIFAIIAILSLSSCKKWLSISPKSEIASTELFKSEQGFKDALMGAYLLMTDKGTYGFESTIGFVDVLAQQYPTTASGHPYANVSTYQYLNGTVMGMKDNIWSKNYSVIANLNNIINTIDSYKDKMHPTHYAMIKGEALGLRAFIHLDLYRLFGYGNLKNAPQGLNVVGLPYVNTYSKQITQPVAGRDYLDNVEKDLLASEALMSKYDIVLNTSSFDLGVEIPNQDQFYNNRRMRFNYYAVKATQARLYLWKGDYEKARDAAEIVTTKGWGTLVSFNNGNINDPNAVNKDYTFSTEHIFALNVQNMFEYIKPYIDQYGPDGLNTNNQRLAHSGSIANTLYEISTKDGMSLSDYRYKELYKKISQTDYLLLKFTYVTNSTFKDRMPLIKLPEMFYILAECYNELGNSLLAVQQLNTVRTNRGIATTYKLSESLNQEQVRAEIQLEYRKEFVSEGQLFYFYKRRGNLTIPNTNKAMDNSVYVLPLPQREIELGN
ncbi:MAG: RagB/SusD family nutrient uptake outer membrane protein [Candidatus Pedobacter colombiensis]|uniref:RagB/SusD family nutrient uptake outer membrane protein n=1 Tax=Candidatus Pedobacter colombiensis TaxID=3121371 RepID=A0AAJ5WCK4_9SPHI|nr:RagB/SusD family nutrient uptake outer membrane protein [Pedobacter sp.]WEK20217.1 MAG: RagB/SusD family nutrient uptake outer membrane protein [Pedobacter sp.]